jgi:glyoxylase-like metal-dependent hydrolase (beta-lactamase superfamily II)
LTPLQYPFDTIPASGTSTEVAPGVRWIRMPLPYALNHINLWLIEDSKGWTVVDTGAQTPEAITAWRTLFSQSMAGRGVDRVIATHMHPDHIGLAGWLTRRFACPLWMTRGEYLTGRVLVADTGREAPDEAIRFYQSAGWDEEAIEDYRTRFGSFGKHVHALPESFRRIHDQERFMIGGHEWRVVVGNGHSPEHACLYCEGLGVLISGDQVLPRISSNVSVFPTEPEADPLGDWLESLAKLAREVPDNVLVLPAHNEPFRGLHARLEQLRNGHQTALARLKRSVQQPKRAVDVFAALFGRAIDKNGFLLNMATGESIAHLNRLLADGEVTRKADETGVFWYQNKEA